MMKNLIALIALAFLVGEPASAQVQFVIDSTNSRLTIGVSLTVSGFLASDSEETALSGDLQADVSDSEIHITDGSIYLADSLRLRFKFGGIFNLGSIWAAASPNAIHLDIVEPGLPASIEGGRFAQGGNVMSLEGELHLTGDGVFAGAVPADPQIISVPDTLALSGSIEHGSSYRLSIPVSFSGTFDLGSDATAVVSLSGEVHAEAPSTVANEKPLEAHEPVASIYPNPSSGSARLEVTLPRAQHVVVDLYDVQGRRVARVVDAFLLAGRRQFDVDASTLAGGVYLAVVSGESVRETIPLVVMQ